MRSYDNPILKMAAVIAAGAMPKFDANLTRQSVETISNNALDVALCIFQKFQHDRRAMELLQTIRDPGDPPYDDALFESIGKEEDE